MKISKAAKNKRRKANARRQAQRRMGRDKKKQCRTCGKPAAMSKRTGRLAKQCKTHLSVDAERKTPKESRAIRPKNDVRRTEKWAASKIAKHGHAKPARVDYRMMDVDGEQVYVSWTRV